MNKERHGLHVRADYRLDDVAPNLQAMLRSLAEASGNNSVTLPYEL